MGRKRPSGEAEGEELELVVVAGTDMAVHPLPRSGRLTLGRAPDCDVRVNDDSVSRRHAVLDMGPPLRIQDLASANGTSVHRAREKLDRADTREVQRQSGETFDVALGDRILLGTAMAIVRRRAARPGADLAGAGDSARPLVQDPAMQRLYEAADRAAQGTISVLLLGETGVGKEVLAREIHRRSPRAAGPFVVIDCAGLAESVLEGELFGHEKGAFTGANDARAGLFELADGGTAFLDEIGELPPAMQVKLLRMLEERTVTRVGGRTPKRVDVRFIAATNRDLAVEVDRGAFRRDLFYRINGMTLSIPPLRERAGEIPELASLFLAEECRKLDRAPAPALSGEALDRLVHHGFPGNVRELRHAIEHAVLLCAGDEILPGHLPPAMSARPSQSQISLQPSASASAPAPAPAPLPDPGPPPARPSQPQAAPAAMPSLEEMRATMDALERQRIVDALEKCGGNQTRAAELLGISRRTLVARLGEYGLPRPRKPSV